jgi:hypothetical protein
VASPRQRTLVLIVAFCLALSLTFFFGYRAGRTARRAHFQNEPVRPWMSVPFVAHTHHTREEVLFEAIHVKPDPHDRRPIRDIAKAQRVPVNQLIQDLEIAIAKPAEAPSGTTPPAARR